jgi:DNA replication protein DnaC
MSQLLIETLLQNLRHLRLKDMAVNLQDILDEAQRQRHGHLSFLERLIEVQLQGAHQRSLQQRLKKSLFSPHMTFENFDWNFQPSLNVEHLKNLQELAFVKNSQPLLILGKTGTGKTHIASALGHRACQAGMRAEIYVLQKLLGMLYASLADDTTDEIIARFTRLDLLVIDKFDHFRTKPEYPSLLLDLISACQDRVSILVTSSINFDEWGSALGNPSITTAIVDRLFHHAELITIRPGRSYRTEGPHAPSVTKLDTNT